jgi:hypothetical protein
MPTLNAGSTNTPIITPLAGAKYFYMRGIQGQASLVNNSVNLIDFLAGWIAGQTPPDHIIFDRIHLNGTTNTFYARRGIFWGGSNLAVTNSVIENFHENTNSDSQAIALIDGPGPILVDNNYLSGAGENMLNGGACPKSTATQLFDVTITRNFFFKPTSWCPGCGSYDGIPRVIKNSFEIKHGSRFLVEGNVIVGMWANAQSGFASQVTPRGNDGGCPYVRVTDVTYSKNLFHDVEAVFNTTGVDGDTPGGTVTNSRLLLHDTLAYNIKNLGGGAGGRQGYGFQLLPSLGYPLDVTFWHNTTIQTAHALSMGDSTATFTATYGNNLQSIGTYGYFGTGFSVGNTSMEHYTPGTIYQKNILYGPFPSPVGATPSQFNHFCAPSGTCTSANTQTQMIFPADINAVLFVNPAANDYRLQAGSPYHNNGSDGADIGADVAAVNAAVAGVEVQP